MTQTLHSARPPGRPLVGRGELLVILEACLAAADDMKQTFTHLSGETANGTWKPRMQDVATNDTGRINDWSLNL